MKRNDVAYLLSYLLAVGGISFLCYLIMGCVPLITGVKSYKSGDTEIDFITGLDLGAEVNGIDRVEDKRGIAPREKEVK